MITWCVPLVQCTHGICITSQKTAVQVSYIHNGYEKDPMKADSAVHCASSNVRFTLSFDISLPKVTIDC